MLGSTAFLHIRVYQPVKWREIYNFPAEIICNGGNNIADADQPNRNHGIINNGYMTKPAYMHFIQCISQGVFRGKIFWVLSHELIYCDQIQIKPFPSHF